MSSSNNDVVITGLGPVTAIGTGCDSFWASVRSGRTHTVARTLAVDIGKTIELPVASMPAAAEIPGIDKHFQLLAAGGMEAYRDVAYTLLATELALVDAKLEVDRDTNRIGMVQAFEAPGVEVTVTDLFGMFSGPPPTDGPPPVYDLLAPRFYNMQPFLYVHVLAKAAGLHGFCTNVHNACSSGAYAIETAAQRIVTGQADVMIVVGGEAFDTAVRLQWFRGLDLYARDHRMRPFDTEPTGFYVGEGAGAMVLESASHAAKRGVTGYATYLGGAFAHQGWKQTIPDVRAARLCDVIKEAVVVAGLPAQEIDLIVPHGACTNLSDSYETLCLERALEGRADRAVLACFKPFVGHMLAASGIIEMIGALLAMKHQTVPAMPHVRPDHTRFPVPPVAEPTARRVETILKLSTGFTGHDTATLFRRV